MSFISRIAARLLRPEVTRRAEDDALEEYRRPLRFAEAAAMHFRFLDDLGFVEVESAPTIVRYRRSDVEVAIYHGRRSFELGCEFRYRGETHSLGALIALSHPAKATQYRLYAARSTEGVDVGLLQLARLVQRCAQQGLRGDPDVFARLLEQKRAAATRFQLNTLADRVRPQAEQAFRSGDYSHAAELYASIEPILSRAELKKLETAAL